MKRTLIIFITFIGGFYFFLEFILPEEAGLTRWREPFINTFIAISVWAAGIGYLNILHLHGGNVLKRRKNWVHSTALLISMVLMAIFYIAKSYYPSLIEGEKNLGQKVHDFLFNDFYMALSSTMFSLLAFYMASAAFKAFRVKTAEAAFMMATAVIVMLGQIPLGIWLSHSFPEFLQFPVMREWLLSVVNSSVFRGVLICATIGSLAISMRLWFSIEKGGYFDLSS